MMNIEKYIKIQERLKEGLILSDRFQKINRIAGADQAFYGKNIISCIIVLEYPEMKFIETAFAEKEINFPYIPGFLAFREAPTIIKAYKKLDKRPDILLVDGHGIAHPRGIGIASHVGILLDIPTIGVAKSRLIGDYEIPKKTGHYTHLKFNNRIIGAVLKTKENCNPLFISPGHKISLKRSIDIVQNCIKGHKLPEPIRMAHSLAKRRCQNLQ